MAAHPAMTVVRHSFDAAMVAAASNRVTAAAIGPVAACRHDPMTRLVNPHQIHSPSCLC